MKEKGRLNRTFLFIGAAVVIAVISIFIFFNTPGQKVKRQLSLGEKYLNELEYENAIQAYRKALSIDPMAEEAYIGMANAYIAQKDYENALAIIEEGIAMIGESEQLLALKNDIESTSRLLWTFDLYDILKYDLFGKDINEWTFDEFSDYLTEHGYMYSEEKLAQHEAQYFGQKTYEQGRPSVGFCGGQINIQMGGDHLWHVGKQGFSPEVEKSGVFLHYALPSISEITEEEFIKRLPSELTEELSSDDSGQRHFFKNGYCIKGKMTDLVVVAKFDDEGAFPSKEMTQYAFGVVNGQDFEMYSFLFDPETGELMEIARLYAS